MLTQRTAALDSRSANPYKSPTIADAGIASSNQSSRWHGFKTGFRNGALWSLLLIVPTVPTFYAEATMHRRMQRTANGNSRIIDLSTAESTFAWLGAIGTALAGITLPWAITAGCVGQARYRKKNPVA
jgi:hypothetical protein